MGTGFFHHQEIEVLWDKMGILDGNKIDDVTNQLKLP